MLFSSSNSSTAMTASQTVIQPFLNTRKTFPTSYYRRESAHGGTRLRGWTIFFSESQQRYCPSSTLNKKTMHLRNRNFLIDEKIMSTGQQDRRIFWKGMPPIAGQ
jgi:branched-subunit amino acid aminotransferase/4-amino-4-deoxychorismate lyase